jgi:hypothetical protein
MIRRRTLFGVATGLLAAKVRAQSMIDAPKVMAGTAVDVIRDEVLHYSPVDN